MTIQTLLAVANSPMGQRIRKWLVGLSVNELKRRRENEAMRIVFDRGMLAGVQDDADLGAECSCGCVQHVAQGCSCGRKPTVKIEIPKDGGKMRVDK